MGWLTFKVRRRGLFFGVMIFLLFGILAGLVQFELADEAELTLNDQQTTIAPQGQISIVIKVKERVLELYADNQLYKTYRVAVGKSSTPTPIGEWSVVWKDYHWGTGFGTRWMGLNVPWGLYGIHGTNKPWSIGQFASHGCIRMRNKDVEELFEWVPIGTPVRIEDQRRKIERNLSYQMSGSDVAVLQMKLKEAGYLTGRADGLFGKATEEALRQYQTDKGLEVTGTANKLTLQSLGL